MLHTFIRRATIIPRPEHVPANALVFNAPRPLYGTLVDDGAAMTWQADFLAGVHYAAILPEDVYRHECLRHNQEMHGCLVWYVSEAEAKKVVRQYIGEYTEKYPQIKAVINLAEFLEKHWQNMFFQHYNGKECQVGSETLTVWAEVTEDWFNYSFEVLPPIFGKGKMFAVSEPANHTPEGIPVYDVYDQRDGRYWQTQGTVEQMRKGELL